jgi:hypothetical protein
LSLLALPLLQFAIDLIHELIRNTNTLTTKRERIMPLQTDTEETPDNFKAISDGHSISFPQGF